MGSDDPREIWWFGLERKWWALVAVGSGTFMAGVTSSVVNTVLPIIMKSYDIDLGTAEWIIMMYMVVLSGLLLAFGRLGDIAGHRRIFLLGCAGFIVVSALCAFAPTAPALIALRGLQAVGTAMIVAAGPAILTHAFPVRQRGQALGMQGAITYLGLGTGPILGGYLTGQLGWQSVFLFNIPFGALVAALTYATIAPIRPLARGQRFDPAGALTFLAGLSALLLALSHGQSWGWTSVPTLGLLAAGVVVLAAFTLIERRVAHPMLDLSFFRHRLFSAAATSAMLNYLCANAVVFLTPFYLIQYRGFGPDRAGLLISSQAIATAIVAPFSGAISDRVESRVISTLGMVITTLGVVLLSLMGEETGNAQMIASLMVIGVGAGIFIAPNNNALMGAVPMHSQGVASAVLGSARNVGMVMGVAVAGAAFATALANHGGIIGPSAGFLPAFRDAFLVVALCGAVGTVTSLVRGSGRAEAAATAPAPQTAAVLTTSDGQEL